MKNQHIILGVAITLFLSGCGVSLRTFSDVDPLVNFEQYATYSYLEFTEGNRKTITGMELERIRVAFARELEKHGLSFVEEGGDVSVQITVYHRQAMDHYYRHPWRYNFMERAISVDIYDNLTRKHIWHGAAVGELNYDPGERAESLPLVAEKIFSRYPVRPKEES